MAGQTIINLGTGGADLNGTSGSTTGSDSNDPKWLEHAGLNYVYLPGVAGNYLSVPDAAALDIVGDIDLRVQVAMDDWTPAATTTLLSKWDTAQKSYLLFLNTNGSLSLYWTTDGTTDTSRQSTANISAADGASLWVRATLDVNNGAAGHDVKFYTSTDGTTWAQLGATVTTAGVTSVWSGTAGVQVGHWGTASSPAAGKFYRAQVYSGIGGTLVLDVDTSRISSGSNTSFTAATGQTVTITRATSGRKAVAVTTSVWLFGTDDYMSVVSNSLINFAETESFTVLIVSRGWATGGGIRLQKVADLATAPYNGYDVRNKVGASGVIGYIGTGTTWVQDSATLSPTAGGIAVTAMIVDRSVPRDKLYVNGNQTAGVSTGSVTTLQSSDPLWIGRILTVYDDGELLAAAVVRRVLSETELDQISAYYSSRWP